MNFSANSCKNSLISWKARKLMDLAETMQLVRTNYHVLVFRWTFQQKVAKSCSILKKHEKPSIWSKLCNFWNKLPCLCISMNFSGKSCKKCLILWKSTKNHRFGQNFQLFEQTTMSWHFHELFSKKLQKVPHSVEKHEKSSIWPKLCNFFEQTTMSLHFDQHFGKKLQKVPQFVKQHEKSWIWPKLSTFRANYHVLAFSWTFKQEVAKSASFRGKAREIIDLAKTMQLFWTNYHVLTFRWTLPQKVAKSASFREKARKTIDLAKTFNFSSKLPCLGIFMNFWARSCKKCLISWKSTRNHRFGQNYATFLNKLPCFGVSMNFWAKGWKKLLNSWKSTKNHPFGQILATFRTNYHVFAFRSTFRKEVAKSASFRETARKIIDLAKALQLLEQATMSFSFWWTFKKKVAKSLSSREKARKIIDFVNLQLSEKTTMFWRFDEHCRKKLQKAARAVEKHEKSSIWPKLCNFFEQTTMSLHFDQLFGKKSQKVPHFVKKHEKSLIWPKLCNFWNKLQCRFPFDDFQEKSWQRCVVSWKSTKNHRFCQLATFRENYHVLTFRWTLQQKVAKSCSCREKARKIINLAKSLQLFEQTTMFWHFDEVFSRKLQKVPHFVKNHEKSSIWPKLDTFRTNWHVFAFWSTFHQKVAKSASFRENHEKSSTWAKLATFRTNLHVSLFSWTFKQKVWKSASFREKPRKLMDLAKTCNFSNKLACFCVLIKFSGKRCKKCLIFMKNNRFGQNLTVFEKTGMFFFFDELFYKKLQKVPDFAKNHKKSSIWPKLATFRTNWHVFVFWWTFQQKVAKSASFREKPWKIIDLAKPWHFSNKLACFCVLMKFSAKTCKTCLISLNTIKSPRFG